MDIQKYLASLEEDEELNIFSKEEDGIQPGLLSQLEMEAPKELHSMIMRAVKNETAATIPVEMNKSTKLTRKTKKYKRYIPLVAAAAMFIVVAGNMNFNKVNEKLSFKPIVHEQRIPVDLNNSENKVAKATQGVKVNKTTDVKENKILTASISTNKISSEEINNDNVKTHNQTLDLKVNHIEELPVVTKSDMGDDNIIVSVNDTSNKNTLQKASADNKENKIKDNTESENMVFASNNRDDFSAQDNSYSSGYVVQPNLNYNYDDNVLLAMNYSYNEDAEYEVDLYMNQTEAINYIYNNGNMIGANIYKFDIQDFYSLKQLLASQNIDIDGLNDSKELSDYVTVHVIIN